MIETKYLTGWKRCKASIIDSEIISSIDYILLVPMVFFETYTTKVVILFIIIVINYFYSIFSHARWGQTIGKYIYGIKVKDNNEERRLSIGSAIKRDIVPLCIECTLFVVQYFQGKDVLGIYFYEKPYTTELDTEIMMFLVIPLLWQLLEIGSMLFSKKRRALHDFIAHSVVVVEEEPKNWSIGAFWGSILLASVVKVVSQIFISKY